MTIHICQILLSWTFIPYKSIHTCTRAHRKNLSVHQSQQPLYHTFWSISVPTCWIYSPLNFFSYLSWLLRQSSWVVHCRLSLSLSVLLKQCISDPFLFSYMPVVCVCVCVCARVCVHEWRLASVWMAVNVSLVSCWSWFAVLKVLKGFSLQTTLLRDRGERVGLLVGTGLWQITHTHTQTHTHSHREKVIRRYRKGGTQKIKMEQDEDWKSGSEFTEKDRTLKD